MGLDITAYKGISKTNAIMDDDSYEAIDPDTKIPLGGNWFRCYINPDFPGRADDMEDQAVYRYEDRFEFRAGSYSGYNWWREELAKLVGYEASARVVHGSTEVRHDQGAWDSDGGPFWELINFADNEGTLGPKVCAKLAKDFQQFANHPGIEGLDERYGLWKKAFEMAADNGCVTFH